MTIAYYFNSKCTVSTALLAKNDCIPPVTEHLLGVRHSVHKTDYTCMKVKAAGETFLNDLLPDGPGKRVY